MAGIRDFVLRQIIYEVGLVHNSIDKFGDRNQTAVLSQINVAKNSIDNAIKKSKDQLKLRSILNTSDGVDEIKQKINLFIAKLSNDEIKKKTTKIIGSKEQDVEKFKKSLLDSLDVETLDPMSFKFICEAIIDILDIFRDLITENNYSNKMQLLKGFSDIVAIPFAKTLRQGSNVDCRSANLALAQYVL